MQITKPAPTESQGRLYTSVFIFTEFGFGERVDSSGVIKKHGVSAEPDLYMERNSMTMA